jgi:hypothetical protein
MALVARVAPIVAETRQKLVKDRTLVRSFLCVKHYAVEHAAQRIGMQHATGSAPNLDTDRARAIVCESSTPRMMQLSVALRGL